MKIGVSLIVAAMGLTAAGIAQSQSNVEGTARGQAAAQARADSPRGAAPARAGETAAAQAGEATAAQARADGSRQAAVSEAGRAAGSARTGQDKLMLDEGTELNAELTRRIDAEHAKPGDEVRAKVTEDVESHGEVVLEKGSRLYGRVIDARPQGSARGDAAAAARSQLAIVFERADVGHGREIPMHATIQALAAAEGEMNAAGNAAGSRQRPSQSGDAFGSISGGGAGRTGGSALGGAGGIVGGGAGAVGSLGGSARGGASAVGSLGGSVGNGVGGAAGSAASRVGGSVRGAGATGAVYRSSNAAGGLDAAGRLGAGSRGVFGLDGLQIVSQGAAGASGAARTGAGQTGSVARAAGSANAGSNLSAAGATVITSASGNVRLDSGTRMLLVAGAGASGSASVSR